MKTINKIGNFVKNNRTAIEVGAVVGIGLVAYSFHNRTFLEITPAQIAHLKSAGGGAYIYATKFGELSLSLAK